MAFENPEDAAIREIENEQSSEILKPWMQEAYSKATALFEAKSINLENYKGTIEYAKANIDADIEKVRELREKFGSDDVKKVADILEAMILDRPDDFLGLDAEIIKTSEFDDYENGADLVLQFPENQHLALAVDVTFGGGAVEKKISKIKEEIDTKLRDIKYFETEIGTMGAKKRQMLHEVPRVVIGVETKSVSNLSAAWVRGDNDFFKDSDAQLILLEEIHLQLKMFTDYAEQTGHAVKAKKYGHALEIVENLLETINLPQKETEWQQDRVLSVIRREMNKLFKVTDEQEAA